MATGGDLKEEEDESSDWSDLPEELKVDILSRLPEKPLISFKRVSKDWYFMISYTCIPKLCPPSPSVPICGVFGPAFSCDSSKSSTVVFSPFGHYYKLHFQRCVAAVYKPPADVVGTYLKSLPFTCTTKDLLDCCNGLLLISCNEYQPTQYIVGNPATRQTIRVPVNPNHQNSNLVDSSLVFDPSESLEFKIIRFVHSDGKTTITLVDVFASETGEWIEYKLPSEAEVPGIGHLKSSVYLDGVLYKISATNCLICLDIKYLGSLNAWFTIEIPNKHTIDKYVGSIGALRGHLYYFNRDASDFLLWTLKNRDQWVMNYSISIYSLGDRPFGRFYCDKLGNKIWSTIQPCALLPGSEEILFETPWFLVTYRLKEKCFNWYDIEMRGCDTRRLGQSFPYLRCLVIFNSIIRRHRQ